MKLIKLTNLGERLQLEQRSCKDFNSQQPGSTVSIQNNLNLCWENLIRTRQRNLKSEGGTNNQIGKLIIDVFKTKKIQNPQNTQQKMNQQHQQQIQQEPPQGQRLLSSG